MIKVKKFKKEKVIIVFIIGFLKVLLKFMFVNEKKFLIYGFVFLFFEVFLYIFGIVMIGFIIGWFFIKDVIVNKVFFNMLMFIVLMVGLVLFFGFYLVIRMI